jgi:hypothetical protein
VTQRGKMVMVRNGILGEARAFRESFAPEQRDKIINQDKLAELARAFAESIRQYFISSDNGLYGWEGTVLTGLINTLEFCAEYPGELPDHTKDFVLSEAKQALQNLEVSWEKVSKVYTEIKLYFRA